ncbi:MAG: hypothetical protein ABUT20_37655 [Bacteroidota bacterium]
MKFFVSFFSIVILAVATSATAYSMPYFFIQPSGDTTIINHKEDGLTNEWPSSKFETDLGTDIRYAVDNDATNLYMAIDIRNEGIQMKILKMGMNMYIDLKGKKKESRGITFPIKEEKKEDETKPAAQEERVDRSTPQQKMQAKKVMRSSMALHLVYMKIFGFEGSPSQDQGISMPASVNVAFSWDSLDVLHIEYLVPLKMLGDISSLDKKEISIGWKLNGMYPSDNPRYYSEQSRGTTHQKIGADNKPIVERETIIREQNIWQKYILTIPR